jgi:copper oxidase (laccase) domain-containing protein
LFFFKKNGFSKGIYKSLNCGRGSKDKKKILIKILNFVSKKMFVKKNKLILMHQTHSNKVIEIKKNNYKKKI